MFYSVGYNNKQSNPFCSVGLVPRLSSKAIPKEGLLTQNSSLIPRPPFPFGELKGMRLLFCVSRPPLDILLSVLMYTQQSF